MASIQQGSRKRQLSPDPEEDLSLKHAKFNDGTRITKDHGDHTDDSKVLVKPFQKLKLHQDVSMEAQPGSRKRQLSLDPEEGLSHKYARFNDDTRTAKDHNSPKVLVEPFQRLKVNEEDVKKGNQIHNPELASSSKNSKGHSQPVNPNDVISFHKIREKYLNAELSRDDYSKLASEYQHIGGFPYVPRDSPSISKNDKSNTHPKILGGAVVKEDAQHHSAPIGGVFICRYCRLATFNSKETAKHRDRCTKENGRTTPNRFPKRKLRLQLEKE